MKGPETLGQFTLEGELVKPNPETPVSQEPESQEGELVLEPISPQQIGLPLDKNEARQEKDKGKIVVKGGKKAQVVVVDEKGKFCY